MTRLTKFQMVRDFVAACIEQTGEPPSIADVMSALGLAYWTAQKYRGRAIDAQKDEDARVLHAARVAARYRAKVNAMYYAATGREVA